MTNTNIHEHSTTSIAPGFFKRAWPIATVGIIGIFSLLLQPLPVGLLDKAPALAALSPIAQRAVLLVNPLILLLVAAVVGAALAHRLGLRSVLAGTAATAAIVQALGKAAALGFALGLALAAVDTLVAPHLGAQFAATTSAQASVTALATGMLYGGLTEEVILRWGAMTLVAWISLSLLGRQRHAVAMVIAIVVAAGLFAAAHLPALAAHVELTPALVARTLLLNGIAGLLYGWLFWRRHLEAAMAAHAATHVGLAAWRLMMQ
jgi:membrane protease YdiL (CAAX protease family)